MLIVSMHLKLNKNLRLLGSCTLPFFVVFYFRHSIGSFWPERFFIADPVFKYLPNSIIAGIPIPFQLIGYFAFTKRYTVGDFRFVDHGYLADAACFIRSEMKALLTTRSSSLLYSSSSSASSSGSSRTPNLAEPSPNGNNNW